MAPEAGDGPAYLRQFLGSADDAGQRCGAGAALLPRRAIERDKAFVPVEDDGRVRHAVDDELGLFIVAVEVADARLDTVGDRHVVREVGDDGLVENVFGTVRQHLADVGDAGDSLDQLSQLVRQVVHQLVESLRRQRRRIDRRNELPFRTLHLPHGGRSPSLRREGWADLAAGNGHTQGEPLARSDIASACRRVEMQIVGIYS